jgi:hypothetical protein
MLTKPGGASIFNTTANVMPAHTASFLACWPRMHAWFPIFGGVRYNLLPFLGQFVTLLVSARISDVSGILIHRFYIRKSISYQRCISDVSAMYQ